MTRMITIAVKEPANCWRVRHVKDSLKTYQDIVGGYIEQVHTDCRRDRDVLQ